MSKAMAVEKIIALPIPCTTRNPMSQGADEAKPAPKDETTRMERPMVRIFGVPTMSEILPIGTRNAAAAKRYEKVTQPSKMACREKSLAIEGSATLTADPKNGVRNELMVATTITVFLGVGFLSKDEGIGFTRTSRICRLFRQAARCFREVRAGESNRPN